MIHARSSKKAKSPEGTDISSFLRQSRPPAAPIGRMNALHASRIVGNMNLHTAGNTLTVGKNKVTTTAGVPRPSANGHRSFTDPLAQLEKHKRLAHSKSAISHLGTELPQPVGPDDPVQLTVWFHELRTYTEAVVVDAAAVPGLKLGNIYELGPVKKDDEEPVNSRKLVFIVRKESLLGKDNIGSPGVSAGNKTKSNFQISLLSTPLQKLLDIPPRSLVQVTLVPDVQQVELDTVEVYLKDVNFARDSQWSLSSSMVGTCCYVDQRVSFLGNRIGYIKTLFREGDRPFSGYIGENTNIIFRSESAKLVFLVQLSREMWQFEENGEIMFHKLVNTLFPKIFKKWRNNNSHHSITIVLFTSVDLTQIPWITLGGGDRPNQCQDYYRVVVDQVSVFIWDKIMASLRLEFANFKHDIMMHLEGKNFQIKGECCPSVKGNLLEAINLSLSLVCDRFRNTDLRHSVNHMIVISPGTGLFDVDYAQMLETSKKMFSLDCALDIVCLSQPPLHTVPLFRYRDSNGKVCHCVPKWCDISYFADSTERTSQWIPRCKIYELQMMGVMENEAKDIQIDRLRLKDNDNVIESMDAYDNALFKPINEKSFVSFSHGSRKQKKGNKLTLPNVTSATFSLMGKVGPSLPATTTTTSAPASAKTNVSTTNSLAHGTVATTTGNSALSTLYNLNKASDDVKGRLFSSIRSPASTAASTIRTRKSQSSLISMQNPNLRKLRQASESTLKNQASRSKRKTRSRMRDLEEISKIRQEKKKSATELEIAEREENNPYWMPIENPSKKNRADNIRCSRWGDVFPPKIKRKMVKWRSLKAPAALPISTALFPTSNELETEYTFQIYVVTLNWENKLELRTTRELMREMIRLRLAMGFQICYGERVKRIEAERKPGGSPESLIKYFPPKDCTGARIYLSLNDEIHRLFCDYNGTLNVQLYRKVKNDSDTKITLGSRKGGNDVPPLIRTRYADEYTPSLIKVLQTKPTVFNWNQFDQLLAGYDDAVTDVAQDFHKMKFVVMPGEIPLNAYHINNEKLSDEEIRVEGLRKLIALIERGKYVRSEDQKSRPKKEEILPEISFYTGNLYDFLKEQAESFDNSGTQPTNSLMISDGLRFNTNVNISLLAQQLQSTGGLKLEDRTWHFKLHPHCFLGSDLVSWLIEAFEDIDNRDEAVNYGQSLMEKAIFRHVDNRHGFLDGHYFYEFVGEYIDPAYKAKQNSGGTGWFRKKLAQDDRPDSSSLQCSPTMNTVTTPSHTRKNSANDSAVSGSETPPVDLRKVISHTFLLDSDASSLSDSQKAKRTKKFMISKCVKYNCDPLRKSFRPEIMDAHYDRVHNPEHCYHIRLHWLNTTTKFIDETIINWSRLCERYGLKLVETPWRELCTIPRLNPFHSFVDLKLALNPLTDPEFKDTEVLKSNKFYYHLHFLRKSDFLLDNRGTNFFLKEHIEISYSWGKSSFKYAQFIHRTGSYIVEIRDNGDFFMAPNNVHILRVNTLINSIPEASSNLKNFVFDSQKVMMNFRETCKDEDFLRREFREVKTHCRDDYGVDFLLGLQ